VFPAGFDYEAPESVADALDAHAKRENAAFLAGGHSLLAEMKRGETAPDTVIDLDKIDRVRGVGVDEGTVRVGALTTYSSLAEDAPAGALADALDHLGDRQIRSRGTVGGNLAACDAGADLPPVALATGATLTAQSRDGERNVDADDFFTPGGETVLRDGELLTEIEFPACDGSAYVKNTHPASGYALVGVSAAVTVESGAVASARVAATGAVPGPVRLSGVESALEGGANAEDAAAHAPDDVPADLLRSDPHASGEYRASVLEPYAERAVTAALERAGVR